jgi:hypothetical protein
MTMNHALFLGWNRPVAGREFDSIETFAGFTKYLDTIRDEKIIDSYEPVMLEQHGGDLNGFIIIRGERDKLHELTNRDEWRMWNAKGSFLLQNWGLTHAYIGEGVGERMETYRKVIK